MTETNAKQTTNLMDEPVLAKVPWSVDRDQFPRSGLTYIAYRLLFNS